jgi:hypothetical protein
VCTTSDINNAWDFASKILSEAFDYLDTPSIPSYTECTEMLESENNSQLTDILKVCSKALTQLNIVSKDAYNNPTEKKKIIGRIGINFLSNSIIDDIAKLTENITLTQDNLGYICDEFFISDYTEQFDYFAQAFKPWHPIDYHTSSYNATIFTVWKIYNSKTKKLLNEYVFEERQTKEESIYLFGTFDDEANIIPSHIYGRNLPMDVYYSTKLILIYRLNGKGKLAKYEINDVDYVMIVINDDEAAKVTTGKQYDL